MNLNLNRTATIVNGWIARNRLQYTLCVSTLFSLTLLLCRILHTGKTQYISMVWNLFLAFIPYAITRYMLSWNYQFKSTWIWTTSFLVWLAFLPNAPYILTDLFHLPNGGAPMWYDLFLLLSFAWNGLLMGYLSICEMESMWRARYPKWSAALFVFPVMFLCGMGVYIGRFMRWNSWDIVTNPFALLTEVGDILLHPWEFRAAWAFTICMGVFLSLVYPLIKKIPGRV